MVLQLQLLLPKIFLKNFKLEDKNSIRVSGSSCFVVIRQGSPFRCLPSLAFHWGHTRARIHLSWAIDQLLYYKSEASYSNRFPRNLLIENSRARETVQSVKGLPYKHNDLSSSPRTHLKKKKVWWCMLVILPLWRWRRESVGTHIDQNSGNVEEPSLGEYTALTTEDTRPEEVDNTAIK